MFCISLDPHGTVIMKRLFLVFILILGFGCGSFKPDAFNFLKGQTNQSSTPARVTHVLNAASLANFSRNSPNEIARVAPGSIASLFSSNFLSAEELVSPDGKGVFELGGFRLYTRTFRDGIEDNIETKMTYIGKYQINFIVPDGLEQERVQIIVVGSSGDVITSAFVNSVPIEFGTFTLSQNGFGPPAGRFTKPSGAFGDMIKYGMPSSGDILETYGTGLGSASADKVTVSVGGIPAKVLYAGRQGQIEGLDQINLELGRGDYQNVPRGNPYISGVVTVDGKRFNSFDFLAPSYCLNVSGNGSATYPSFGPEYDSIALSSARSHAEINAFENAQKECLFAERFSRSSSTDSCSCTDSTCTCEVTAHGTCCLN